MENENYRKESYRKLIGSLLFIAVNTRPDIAECIFILAQKVSAPTQEDWNEAKQTLKYLKGTINMKLRLGPTNDRDGAATLIGYADANWGEDKINQKSNSGFVFKLFGATISWYCKKQTCVALSTFDAEFISLSDTCRQAQWLKRICDDFGYRVNLCYYNL